MPPAQPQALALMLEAGRLLSSQLELSELLKTVLELSSRVVGAETASLLLLDEKSQELYFDVALGLDEKVAGLRIKLGEGVAGSVAKERKPVVINDVRADGRWRSEADKSSGFVTRSILAVPMTNKDKLIGVLEAINKKDGAFSFEDLRTFESFASQASVAIENARLFSSLKEEKFKLDTIFSEMTDGAILADEKGRILLSNGAARKLMGSGADTVQEALAGMAVTPSLHEIFSSPAQETEFAAVREEPKKLVLAGKVTRFKFSSSGHSRQSPKGTGWLCVFRDETESWQKEKVKRTFLSLISHKLKTPLAAITGYSDVLVEELAAASAPPAQLKAATSIATQGKKLAGLVEKLLRYVTLESPENTMELTPCPVDEIVAEALEKLKDFMDERKARAVFKASGGLTVLGDREKLRDVIGDLVENAVKFDRSPEKEVRISAEPSGDKVALRVSDRGPGIPPEDQDKVFGRFHQVEKFFTGQVDGWGLGLSYVRKVVEWHGGTVALKSRLGEGTTVSVLLPRGKAS